MKIYIETYGCSANQNNSEIMAGLIDKANLELVLTESKADLIILNTCVVKGPTESKEISRIKEIVKSGKKIVVAGCLSQVAEKKIREISDKIAIIGTHTISEIVEVINHLKKGEAKILTQKRKEVKLGLPTISKNPTIAIIQISEGCLGNCAYCSVKFAKGDLYSYPIDKIVFEVKKAVDLGFKEIWLTSQDNSAYGKDINENLVTLLKKILKIKGEYKIRIGMMNPNHIVNFLEDLVELYQDSHIFKFIHVPLQSGSDLVLKKMNRYYSVAEFEKIINSFRLKIPNITIATDMICGFPEESEFDFEKSLEIIKRVQPDVVNISKFWLRKGTAAQNLKQLDSKIIKARSKQMSELFNETLFEKNKKFVGTSAKIIIDEQNDLSFVGRDECYRPIAIKGEFKLGQIVNVKIKKAEKHYLLGEYIVG